MSGQRKGISRRESLRRAGLLSLGAGAPFSFVACAEQVDEAPAAWLWAEMTPINASGYGTDPNLLHPAPAPWPKTLTEAQLDAVAALADLLADLPPRPTTVIAGMMNTKDAAGFLDPLVDKAERLIAVAIPGEENGLDAPALADIAAQAGLTSETADSAADAVTTAAQAHPNGRIVICGSLYLAGAILRGNG